MAEMHKYYFVDSNLVSQWSDDGVHVSWLDPMSGEAEEKAEIGSLFWSRIGEDEQMDDFISSLDSLFSSYLECIKKENFNFFFTENNSGRGTLLFQMYRSDSYLREEIPEKDNPGDFVHSAISLTPEVVEQIIERCLLNKVYHFLKLFTSLFDDALLLLRLEPVLLHAPEGSSFILGSKAMNIINPFLGSRHPSTEEESTTDLYGACLVMPVSPSDALCLYDPVIYKLRKKGGKCVLTSHDVDILNKVQIYNGEDRCGYVYKGDGSAVKELISSFEDTVECDNDFDNDCYPFDTELSCLQILLEAEENFSSYYERPVSKFVEEMKEFNIGYKKRIHAPGDDREKEMHRRYVHAHNLLFKNQIE